MSQRIFRAIAYAALAKEFEIWRQLSVEELLARVGAPARSLIVEADGEDITLDLVAQWLNPTRHAVRIIGVASGASHFKIERVEEETIISLCSEEI